MDIPVSAQAVIEQYEQEHGQQVASLTRRLAIANVTNAELEKVVEGLQSEISQLRVQFDEIAAQQGEASPPAEPAPTRTRRKA